MQSLSSSRFSVSPAGGMAPQRVVTYRGLRAPMAVGARGAVRRSSGGRLAARAGMEYEQLRGVEVVKAASGERVELLSLWKPEATTKVVIPFMTHFADLSSWEYAQKLVKVMPTLEASSIPVFAVGLGSTTNAREFARILKFPLDNLYCDPDGSAYKALGFSPGFAPDLQVSAYAKLLPMLAGIGSPGTVQEVIRGYVGDKDSKPVFDTSTPFDVLGTGYQRPFELATLRLFNMIGILPKWKDLSPENEVLLTQQGGTVVFEGMNTLFRHDDSGILKYTDVDQLLRTVLQADIVAEAVTLPMATSGSSPDVEVQ